VDLLIT